MKISRDTAGECKMDTWWSGIVKSEVRSEYLLRQREW